MITWLIENTEEGDDICKASEMEGLRNWAAGLDADLPFFFELVPWEDTVPAEKLPQLIAELDTMLASVDAAPEWTAQRLRAMRAVAQRAARAGRGVVIG